MLSPFERDLSSGLEFSREPSVLEPLNDDLHLLSLLLSTCPTLSSLTS
jgi:hypothetical protein